MDLVTPTLPVMLEAISHTCRGMAGSKAGINTDVLTPLASADWFEYGARFGMLHHIAWLSVLLSCIKLLYEASSLSNVSST